MHFDEHGRFHSSQIHAYRVNVRGIISEKVSVYPYALPYYVVKSMYERMKFGERTWEDCCPRYSISRVEAAYILCNFQYK